MMPWRKLGLVYEPSGLLEWGRTHGHLPTFDPTVQEAIRIYFTGLDAGSYGRIGYVDLDRDDPTRVLAVSPEPVLGLGAPGAFDDCGVVASCIVPFRGETLLYYHGFQRTTKAPYLLFTGLAVAGPEGGFRKTSQVPVLDRVPDDPFLRAAPCVLVEDEALRMWYVSCEAWTEQQGGLHYRCNIRHAVSRDGRGWIHDEGACLAPEGDDEYAVGRPWVIRDGGRYRMWYSRRGFREPYAMGYAESADGLRWERMDAQAGLVRSGAGWDSEMVCYPCLAEVEGRRLLFYNGNRRGATGFGVAELLD